MKLSTKKKLGEMFGRYIFSLYVRLVRTRIASVNNKLSVGCSSTHVVTAFASTLRATLCLSAFEWALKTLKLSHAVLGEAMSFFNNLEVSSDSPQHCALHVVALIISSVLMNSNSFLFYLFLLSSNSVDRAQLQNTVPNVGDCRLLLHVLHDNSGAHGAGEGGSRSKGERAYSTRQRG